MLLDLKSGEGMQFVVVENLKVFFFEVTDNVTLLIANDNRDQHSDNVYFELKRLTLRTIRLLSQ
jgi:hypothetical protein